MLGSQLAKGPQSIAVPTQRNRAVERQELEAAWQPLLRIAQLP